MYQIGDAIVHPKRGAGIIVGIVERSIGDTTVPFYKIELLSKTSTRLMIPTERADEIGLRPAIGEEQLAQVWQILASDPEDLPTHSRKRFNYLNEKIDQMDVLQVAEVIRDVLWMQEEEGGLKTRDKSVYQEAIKFLAGEVAAVKSISLAEAEREIKARVLD